MEFEIELVTPCVGVWIEIYRGRYITWKQKVTPCVGVWIEMRNTV